MRSPVLRRIAVALLAALALTACYKEMKEAARSVSAAVKEMQVVEKELNQRYPNEQLNVMLNKTSSRTILRITFVNSPLNEAKYMDRDARANEVAGIVKGMYDRADTIVVAFQKQRGGANVEIKSSIDSFEFPGR